MNVIYIFLLLALIAVLLAIIRRFGADIVIPIQVCITVVLMTFAMTTMSSIIEKINILIPDNSVTVFFSVLLKSMGVLICASVAVDICRDAGQGSLASGIEFLARCEIVYLALPLINDLLTLTVSVLE